MKASVQRRFNRFQGRYPDASSYIHFAKAIKGQNLMNKTISWWFKKLVDKDDYCIKEKTEIIKHLRWLTKQDEKS